MKVYRYFNGQKYVADILCNKCGVSCHIECPGTPVKWITENGETGYVECSEEEHMAINGPNAYGLIEPIVYGGYDSSPLEDCTTYTFSLCEKCLKELFDTFNIPVEIGEYNLGDMIK